MANPADSDLLLELIRQFPQEACLQNIVAYFAEKSSNQLFQLSKHFQQAIEFIEQQLWIQGLPRSLLDAYQALCRLQQASLDETADDSRHHFIITIPVADRPQHLQACINSLLKLCQSYGYGGQSTDGRYQKITVLVADDSEQQSNIEQHQTCVEQASKQGLDVVYFGLLAQQDLLNSLGARHSKQLEMVLGELDANHFSHKGASTTRNISYLKLQQMAEQIDRPLFYFIDSDQLFCVNVGPGSYVYSLNYFYYLDRVFNEYQPLVVTGKVVGDPPVSPAVMAANLVDDVNGFFQQLGEYDPKQECGFHQSNVPVSEGAYHDMGELFGFNAEASSVSYQCSIEGRHCCSQTLDDFVARLDGFFDGAHPTRRSRFEYQPVFDSIKPARTVYTGNYILHPQALNYFIPFAGLKLRMAGPMLGRIIQAEQNDKFISVNLPMLHERTHQVSGIAEFRAGVQRDQGIVDLGCEYERQYFGDVMLFTIIKLTERSWPDLLESPAIQVLLEQTEADLAGQYRVKQQQVNQGLSQLRMLVDDPEQWWAKSQQYQASIDLLHRFINNMQNNYGDTAPIMQTLHSKTHREQRLQQIAGVLSTYQQQRFAWQRLLQSVID